MRKLNLLNTGRPVSMTSLPGSPVGGVSEVSGDKPSELSQCLPPLTASTSAQLQRLHNHCPPGTVVFLQPEQTLVFKVDIGWRYIVVILLMFLSIVSWVSLIGLPLPCHFALSSCLLIHVKCETLFTRPGAELRQYKFNTRICLVHSWP